jgi:hypothetical protein
MASAKEIVDNLAKALYLLWLGVPCKVVDGPVVFKLDPTAQYLDRGTSRILDCCLG